MNKGTSLHYYIEGLVQWTSPVTICHGTAGHMICRISRSFLSIRKYGLTERQKSKILDYKKMFVKLKNEIVQSGKRRKE